MVSVTRWEYLTMMAATVPIRGALELAVVHLGGHMWDYEREPMGPNQLLNLMGGEGWELVSVLTLGETEGADGTVWQYTLKRPRAERAVGESVAVVTTDASAS